MSSPEIRPQGLSPAGEAEKERPAEAVRLQLSRAAKLSDLADEYVFYSDALLRLGVRLGSADPFADFLASVGSDVRRISLQFNRPIFEGLVAPNGDQEWNHVLYGMPAEYWQQFLSFMGSLAFNDREFRRVTRLRPQQLSVVDPLFLERATSLPETLPLINVTHFILETNFGVVYFQPPKVPALDRPRVVQSRHVFEDTEIFAKALSDEHNDPYGLIDEHRSKQAGRDIAEVELEKRMREFRESDNQASD